MRHSMRNSFDSTPSMRGPKPKAERERATSPFHFPGFGRSSSKQAKPLAAPPPPHSSKFADSSDEDEPRTSFRSRIIDSSDDEEPAAHPPARGMQRTMRTSAPAQRVAPPRQRPHSPDLSDSDDQPVSPIGAGLRLGKTRAKANGKMSSTPAQGATLAQGSLRRSGSGRGTIASPGPPGVTTTVIESPGTTRPTQSRRGSFMSILRRKKPDPDSKVHKSELESPARRDTPLERSRPELEAVRRQESYQSGPKLVKRGAYSRENSMTLASAGGANWPLRSDREKEDELGGVQRPFTADAGGGVTGAEAMGGGRPEVGRRVTSTGILNVDLSGGGGMGTPRKKKKFQALRKMFGLDE